MAASRPLAARFVGIAFTLATCMPLCASSIAGSPRGGVGDLPLARVPFRSYGLERGLGNLAVTCLAQDSLGFLWAGTQDGLYRYDGDRFQHFGLRDGLPSAHVYALAAGKDGRLLVATHHGLARFSDDRFEAIGESAGVPQEPINSVAIEAAGAVWLATASGLYRGEERFEMVAGWPGGEATSLSFSWDQQWPVWVSTRRQVGRLEQNGRWTWLDPNLAADAPRIDAIAADTHGAVWVRTVRHLLALHPGTTTFSDESDRVPFGGTQAYLNLDRSGNLWVPTNRGIAHQVDGTWTHYGAEQGLHGWTDSVLEDREGSLWVAGLGVNRMVGRGRWLSWAEREGLPSEITWAIHRDRAGRLWVGTAAGLAQATPAGWRVIQGTGQLGVRTIAEAPDGTLWLGGSPPHLLHLNPNTGWLERFSDVDGIHGRLIVSAAFDRQGTLWLGIDRGGLLHATSANGRPRFVQETLPGGRSDERISLVREDRLGRLWAAGSAGLLRRENGVWRRFGAAHGLRADFVVNFALGDDDTLWVGYFEPLGIDLVRIDGERLTAQRRLDTSSGLFADKLYFLGFDARRQLWAGLANGVDVVTPVLVTHYGVADGLIGEDCDTNAFFAEPDGGVFVGTSAGLSYFRGDRPDPVPQPPLTRIVAASLGGRRLAPSITTTRVPFAANTFEVRFAGLSFLSEESVEHEVRMIGLEPAWRRTITREARYAALAAGTYRFEVRARIGHGQWSEPARVAFEVLPPWWQSSPSRLGFTAVALGGVGAALLTWRARWRRRQRELEALVAVRTRELAEANQTLESLSVTDPLTGLKNRRYLSLVLPRDIAHITRVYRNVLEGKAERLTINTDIVFLMVDLDHFKAVNDLHGHGAGDHVLNTIPEILGRVTRQSDTVVRWGGEEFLVVARNANRHEAQTMAERIKNAVGKHTFDVGGGTTVRLTCSVGYAVYPLLDASPDALSWQQTIEIADHCMYAAKRSGRNAWVGVVGQAPSPARSLEALLPGALAEAAKAGELVVATSLAGPAAIVWEQSAQ